MGDDFTGRVDHWVANQRKPAAYRPTPESIASGLEAEAERLRGCTWQGDISPTAAKAAQAAAIRALIAERDRLRNEHGRLRAMIRVNFLRLGIATSHEEIDAAIEECLKS